MLHGGRGLSRSPLRNVGFIGIVAATTFGGCALFTSFDELSNGATGVDGSTPTGDGAGPDATSDGSTPVLDASTDAPKARADLYRDAVLADTPLAYWRLDETAGSDAKDELGTHGGNYLLAPTLGSPGVFGDAGAVLFPAASKSHVEVGGDAFQFPNNAPFTIEMWVKPAVFKQFQWLAGTEDLTGGTTRIGWSLFADESTLTYQLWRPNDGGTNVVRGLSLNTTPLVLGRFQHVAFTYNGLAMKGYIDGVLVGTAQSGAPAPAVGTLLFGCRRASTTIVHCLEDWTLDEIAIYDHPLADARLAAHAAFGKP